MSTFDIENGIKTYLAWTFDGLMEGTFKRNKYVHHDYPIVTPLPTLGRKTKPLKECEYPGPYIYFVLDRVGNVCYVGKTLETVIHRWVRPGNGGPVAEYWSHSTKSGGNIFNIAKGLREGSGPFQLRYSSLTEILRWRGERLGSGIEIEVKNSLASMETKLQRIFLPL